MSAECSLGKFFAPQKVHRNSKFPEKCWMMLSLIKSVPVAAWRCWPTGYSLSDDKRVFFLDFNCSSITSSVTSSSCCWFRFSLLLRSNCSSTEVSFVLNFMSAGYSAYVSSAHRLRSHFALMGNLFMYFKCLSTAISFVLFIQGYNCLPTYISLFNVENEIFKLKITNSSY